MRMIITYHGGQHFKITHGQLTVAIDPSSKESSVKAVRYGADVVLVSTWHEDFNGVDQMAHAGAQPFVIKGPGEYEVGGLFIKGFAAPSQHDGVEHTTIYTFRVDDIAICFLGALSTEDLSVEAKQAFDEVDILFVPVGGEGSFDAAAAYKFAVKREPKIIVPMGYAGMGEKGALERFLKEASSDGKKPIDKLVMKKKDLPANAEVIVLEHDR
jgi:L-ascorbate metabolism protein UlaG (beta-lactamase superfamily)